MPQRVSDTAVYLGTMHYKLSPEGVNTDYSDSVRIVRFDADSICTYFTYVTFVGIDERVNLAHKITGYLNESFEVHGKLETNADFETISFYIRLRFISADSISLRIVEKYKEPGLTNEYTFGGKKIQK